MEWTEIISLAAAVLALIAAGAVLFRVEGSVAGKLFAVGMLLFGGEALINFFSVRQLALNEELRWQELRYVPLSFLPATWMAFSLTFSRGNYRDYLRGRRNLLILFFLAPVLVLVFTSRQLLSISPDETTIDFGLGAQLLEFILIGASIIVLMNLEQTFRSSVGTQRWKIKLAMLGIGGLFLVRIYTSCQLVIARAPDEAMASLDSAMLILSCALIGVSVIRTKAFSIDLYPSQTALHRSVIVVMIGVYLIIIGVLSKLTTFLGGETDFQLRALVILIGLVGLALLLMSDRLRERSRAWINRYFSRPHYNYHEVWTSFTREMATIRTTEELCPSVAKWVSETLHALSVSVWLVDDTRSDLRLYGSTLDPDKHQLNSAHMDPGDWTVIVQSAIHLDKVVNLDRSYGRPIEVLTRIHPTMFRGGGDRVAVPLSAGNENLGIIIVGDRVDGVPFTSEDEALLTTVAEQAAIELQSIQLSGKLMQAREMEAFQNMSTFFVHDLKNTASSLSLMLQNLPQHFDNPEFRADALRSIGKSVTRINQMIQSLSALRRKLVINPSKINLADTISTHASNLAKDRGIRLVSNVQRAGPVNVDVEQIDRVLTNLIVNAHEASDLEKPIKFSTGQHDGFAFLQVTDEGEGMSKEYIDQKLFRPFQTTKKTGTGIGLYHSKLIVDAHGGRLEVHSRQGAGTTFKVLLPLLELSDEADRIDRG